MKDVEGSTAYEYDKNGNILKVTKTKSGSNRQETVTKTFEKMNRVTSYTDSKGRVTRYIYDSEENLTRTERTDGTRETNTYDALNRPITRKDIRISDRKVINEYHYTYDARGNII